MYRRNDIAETETVYKVVLECLTQSDRPWTLSGWHSLFSNPDTRKLCMFFIHYGCIHGMGLTLLMNKRGSHGGQGTSAGE